MKPMPKRWMECSHVKLLLCWAGYSSHVEPITQLSLDLTVSVVVQQLHDKCTNLWKHLCFAVTITVHLFGFFSCSTTGLPRRTKVLFFKCCHSHCTADKKFKSERACKRCAAKTHMSKQGWLLCYCINHFPVGEKTPYIQKIAINYTTCWTSELRSCPTSWLVMISTYQRIPTVSTQGGMCTWLYSVIMGWAFFDIIYYPCRSLDSRSAVLLHLCSMTLKRSVHILSATSCGWLAGWLARFRSNRPAQERIPERNHWDQIIVWELGLEN